MGPRFLGVSPHPRPPRSPAAAVLVGGRMLPLSEAARQTDYRLHCPLRNCPCATAPPIAERARPTIGRLHALHPRKGPQRRPPLRQLPAQPCRFAVRVVLAAAQLPSQPG